MTEILLIILIVIGLLLLREISRKNKTVIRDDLRGRQKKESGCLSKCIRAVIVALSIFVIAVMVSPAPEAPPVTPSGMESSASEATERTDTPAPTPKPTDTPAPTEVPPEMQLELAVKNAFTYNYTDNSLAIIDGILFIETDLSIFTPKLSRDSFINDVRRLLKNLSVLIDADTVSFDSVSIAAYSDFLDVYGNESRGISISCEFKTETIKKINFENVRIGNIPVIADSWYDHPAFNN